MVLCDAVAGVCSECWFCLLLIFHRSLMAAASNSNDVCCTGIGHVWYWFAVRLKRRNREQEKKIPSVRTEETLEDSIDTRMFVEQSFGSVILA